MIDKDVIVAFSEKEDEVFGTTEAVVELSANSINKVVGVIISSCWKIASDNPYFLHLRKYISMKV